MLEGPDGPVIRRSPAPGEGSSEQPPLIESATPLPLMPAPTSQPPDDSPLQHASLGEAAECRAQQLPEAAPYADKAAARTRPRSRRKPAAGSAPHSNGTASVDRKGPFFPDADDEDKEDEDEGEGPGKEGCWYRTQVFLPNNCPVLRAEGQSQPKRSLAVSAACIEAIRQLHEVIPLVQHIWARSMLWASWSYPCHQSLLHSSCCHACFKSNPCIQP